MRITWTAAQQEARCEVGSSLPVAPRAIYFVTGADSTCHYRAGHYGRAVEDAVQAHKSQWPKDWEGKNPLSGGVTFASMSPTERV